MQIQKKVKGIFLLLAVCFMACSISTAQAAEADSEEETASAKPALSKTTMTIPIYGKTVKKLSVVNPVEGATYIFQSANKKIATINKTTGKLTGKKKGTATITLLKQGKKKNTLIATCKVKVVGSTITKKNQTVTASVNGTFQPVITYENTKASYTYKSSNKKVVRVKEKIDSTGATSMVVTALSKGKATVTVTEKYKKKTSVIGTIAVTVKEPVLDTKSISMITGQKLKISNAISISYEDTTQAVSYDYQSSDSTALEINGTTITAKKAISNAKITVYRIISGKRSSLGTVTVTVSNEIETIPEASGDSLYIDLSDYENDYEDGFDNYDDNAYYSVGSDYIEDETTDPDDSYDDYENYLDEPEHTW